MINHNKADINFYFRIGNNKYNRRLPLKIQIFDFFRITEIKFIMKTDFSNVLDQVVLMRGKFGHEIQELKNKCCKIIKRITCLNKL